MDDFTGSRHVCHAKSVFLRDVVLNDKEIPISSFLRPTLWFFRFLQRLDRLNRTNRAKMHGLKEFLQRLSFLDVS